MQEFVVFFEHDVTLSRKCYIKAENEEQASIIVKSDDFNPFDYENEDIEEICGNDIRIGKISKL